MAPSGLPPPPQEVTGFTLMTANVNAWSSATRLLEWLRQQAAAGCCESLGLDANKPMADVICCQELRLPSESRALAAQTWLEGKGFLPSIGLSQSTGDGALQDSGGVGVAVSGHVASAPMQPPEFAGWEHRLAARKLNVGLPQGLVVVSVYGRTKVGIAGNLDLLEAIAAFVLRLPCPWVVAGDWNFTPYDLEESGLLSRLHGVVAAPALPTCTSPHQDGADGSRGDAQDADEDEAVDHDDGVGGRVIDFFVVSETLAACVGRVDVLHEAPLGPHSPVFLLLEGVAATRLVERPRRFQSFPIDRPIGPQLQEDPIRWSWDTGGSAEAAGVGSMITEWFGAAEAYLVKLHGLEQRDVRRCTGRGDGPQTSHVPLCTAWEREVRARHRPTTTAWVAFHTLCLRVAAVAGSRLGKRGRELLALWRMKLFDIVVAMQVPEDVPGSPHHPCSVQALGGLIDSFAEGRRGDAAATWEYVESELERRRGEDAKQQAAAWRKWAQGSLSRGGKAAQRYARRRPHLSTHILDDEDAGEGALPVAGAQAIQKLVDDWLPYWSVPAGQEEDPTDWVVDDGIDLPALTIDDLQRACKAYSEGAGLGWDGLNPRVLLQLPEECQAGFLDILAEFERQPRRLEALLSHVIFLPKPDGGIRPIGLMCLFSKLYSKMRQPVCRAWEHKHREPFFWGSSAATACDRAGWHHNVLSAFGGAAGFATATVLVDLHKFYEHVRWSHLRAAAVQFQFPVMLLRALCVVYSGGRRILYGGAVSASLFATRSVIAGCSAATTLAKLLLLGPLRSTLQNRPQLGRWAT